MLQKGSTAIISPEEYSMLRRAAEKDERVLMDISLFTGMRYAELLKFQEHPEWFMPERKCVFMPQGSVKGAVRGQKIMKKENNEDKKERKPRTTPQRYILLSSYGVFILEHYFEDDDKPKFHSSLPKWDMRLKKYAKKAGLAEDGKSISNKSFRKSWESWLAVSYPEEQGRICQSQGHTQIVSMQHYVSTPFTATEKEQIKEKVAGWL